jgi:tRNA-dihydrouridine synthase B
MHIGPYQLSNKLIVAPMAGVTDRPFRMLCKKMGAGHAVSEMITANQLLYGTAKTRRRVNFAGELAPVSVQIAGADPAMLAQAARYNVALGAQIIDINMGCPAKKVCNVMAGSALLQNESLVARILEAVVKAVDVPVTLKTRLGWDHGHQNIVQIAKLAQDAGIQALAIHGRTRACGYRGQADYTLIKEVRRSITIPIIANGDIDTPHKARQVLNDTGADAIMIGRAAQGRPWIFREIQYFLETGCVAPPPSVGEIREVLVEHLLDHYTFYGEYSGCRIARKHIAWYTKGLPESNLFRQQMYQLETTQAQLTLVQQYFNQLADIMQYLSYDDATSTHLAA